MIETRYEAPPTGRRRNITRDRQPNLPAMAMAGQLQECSVLSR
jgi:hypothetical protein